MDRSLPPRVEEGAYSNGDVLNNTWGALLGGTVIGLALVLVAWLGLGIGDYSYQGSLIDPPVPAIDFTLTDQYGEPFRLSEQKGNVVLIFFGYTHCPDVCPITLSEFRLIKRELGENASRVRFVFVTVDPERDTREAIRSYLKNFDSEIIGLTGTQEQLKQVWSDYWVYAEKQETGSAAGYLVDHTARVYAIDTEGNLLLTYPFGMEIEKLISDVEYLLQERTR